MTISSSAALAAADRLIAVAAGDTGQARRPANFLLAWWDGDTWGHFPIADLFSVDRAVSDDMATLFVYLGKQGGAVYINAFGDDYAAKMAELAQRWC